jgi:hypothetical protein
MSGAADTCRFVTSGFGAATSRSARICGRATRLRDPPMSRRRPRARTERVPRGRRDRRPRSSPRARPHPDHAPLPLRHLACRFARFRPARGHRQASPVAAIPASRTPGRPPREAGATPRPRPIAPAAASWRMPRDPGLRHDISLRDGRGQGGHRISRRLPSETVSPERMSLCCLSLRALRTAMRSTR